jgi:YfiH family protein
MVDTRLPQPNGTFEWVQAIWPPALVCRNLTPFADHLITSRAWALGTARTNDTEGAWAEVAAALGAPIARVHQVHGADRLILRAGEPRSAQRPDADIIVSNDPDTAIAIQSADCVPLLIADRRTGVVAAAHAGWRGLALGVPRAAVRALVTEFGSRPDDLVAAAGPSIGACCYQVGRDVIDRFEEAGWSERAMKGWFFDRPQATDRNPSLVGLPAGPRSGRWYFDSRRAATHQLEEADVPADQIFAAELCTASHPTALCSYRRDGVGAGRIVAAIRARGAP